MEKLIFTDKKIIGILAFLLGLTCTFQAFKFLIGGFYFYPSDIFYYLLIFFLILAIFLRGELKISIPYNVKFLYLALILYFFIVIFSGAIPIFEGASAIWAFASVKAVLKFLIFLFFLLLVFLLSNDLKNAVFSKFLKGFICSIFIQMIFSLGQLIAWYFKKVELNKLIFGNFFGIEAGHSWTNFVVYPILRVTGLHWDPAYLAIWTLIGLTWIILFWKNNFSKKLFLPLFLLIFIMTFSRTGIFALFAVLGIVCLGFLVRLLYKMRISMKLNIKNSIGLLLIVCIVLGAAIYLIENNRGVTEILTERLNVESVSSQRHFNYFLQGLRAISSNPLTLFFGFGYRNGGRGLENISDIEFYLPGIKNTLPPWSPESDFVNSYLELGLIGFFSYLFVFFIGIFYLRKIKEEALRTYNNKILSKSDYLDVKKKALFFSICYGFLFFAGFFYGFKDSLWYWLLIMSSFSVAIEFQNKLLTNKLRTNNDLS